MTAPDMAPGEDERVIEDLLEWFRTRVWVDLNLLEALAAEMAGYLRAEAPSDRVAAGLVGRYDELRPGQAAGRGEVLEIPGPVLQGFRRARQGRG